MTKPDKSRPVGRPSKYEPRYCDEVVEFCREGYSITAFAGEIGVARDTLTDWGARYPEFLAALKRAKSACARWWEERGRSIGEGGGGPGSATLVTFQLRNQAPDDFQDRRQVEHSGSTGPIQIVLNQDDVSL